jgi:hypothetical protein
MDAAIVCATRGDVVEHKTTWGPTLCGKGEDHQIKRGVQRTEKMLIKLDGCFWLKNKFWKTIRSHACQLPNAEVLTHQATVRASILDTTHIDKLHGVSHAPYRGIDD